MNHNYETPEKGTIDWHIPLNDNFRRLDIDVEVRDVASNRSQYSPTQGGKFLATDTGDVYIGTGSTWALIGSLSQSGGPSVDELLSAGYIVISADGLTGSGTIDPTQSSTPVQDALDICGENGGGVVRLPYRTVAEDGPVIMHDNCALKGRYGSSVVSIQNTNTDGIVFDVNQSPYSDGSYITNVEIDGITVNGPGAAASTGYGIRDTGLYVSRIGQLKLSNWNGVTYMVESGAGSFENDIQYLEIVQCDAGNASALIDWNSAGAPNHIGTIAAYPTDADSGTDSKILHGGGIHARIDVINVGGTGGQVFYDLINGLSIGTVNWEPSRQNTVPSSLFGVNDISGFQIEQLSIQGTAKYAYDEYLGGSMVLAVPEVTPIGTLQNNVLKLKTEPAGPITYYGSENEVDGMNLDTSNQLTTIADL